MAKRAAKTVKGVICAVVVLDLYLAANLAWPAYGPNAFALFLNSSCPPGATLGSIAATRRVQEAQHRFQGLIHAVKTEDGLTLWDTPGGQWWEPKGDLMLSYLLAEQASKVYGDSRRGVRPRDIVLDCGANIGGFTRTALDAGARLVVAIEPAPLQLKCLRRNFQKEISQGRVIVYPKGVWDHDDQLRLSVDEMNEGADSLVLKADSPNSVLVPLTTIDNLVTELKLPRVDFIKMDIEGAERQALAGARHTLVAFHPHMAISSEHLPDDVEGIPSVVKGFVQTYRTECGHCVFLNGGVRPEVIFFY